MFSRLQLWGLLSLSLFLFAACPPMASSAGDASERIRQSMMLLLSGVEPDSVAVTPIPGLYEVVIGTRIVYLSEDGRYLIEGSITDLESRQSLTDPRVRAARLDAVRKIGERNMLVYPAQAQRHRVTVFTDIDSGHGRKMHRDIADYTALGIELRYLFFPRAGVKSASYRKAVSIWCADDRKIAMAAAATGKKPPEKECENPVLSHMRLGEMMGVTGTPVLLLESGEMIPAYIPAEELARILDRGKQR
ncbi:MAG: DsbC family protein [Sedimenticola sp.]